MVGVIGTLAGSAYADDPPPPRPDPAAERVVEANLESIEHRRGIVFGAALGASVTIGGGTGTGGLLNLHLGHVATPRTVITFELNGSAQFHQNPAMELVANNITTVLAGFQYWVGPSLWFRGGLGAGTYHCNQCLNSVGQRPSTKAAGPAGGVSVGVDLVRFHGTVLGFELSSSSLLTRDGVIVTNAMSLGLSFD